MVKSALSSARYAEEIGLPHDRIVLSVKMSDVQEMISVYEDLAA
jgi:(E)-4-hydroxy-3-methylbut-2-enyl-diphosphate synthase